MNLLKIAVATAALLCASAAWGAECAPEKMVKVTYRNITPGRNPAAMTPITMYRHTERYGRMEGQGDAAAGRRQLVVVAEPDVWFVNLAEKTGQHVVDPGPVFEFRAPILTTAGTPAVFARLETGCELDFLATYAPRPVGELKADGQILDRHQVSLGADRLEILVRRGLRRVYSVTHYKGDKVLVMLRYLDYATDLTPDMALFAKPEGVTYTEGKTAAPPPKS
jgi:hypothetical protein